jgi:hypothetical protein
MSPPGLIKHAKARDLGKGRFAPREERGGLWPSLTEVTCLAF